jgi:hypothetical protein
MSDIRKSLESLADSIEKIQKQPAPRPEIKDRELSGNKIHGGVITNFSSVGIKDEAARQTVVVRNDGLHVDTITVKEINSSVNLFGSLDVKGKITAEKLQVDEITADVRHEKTSPLEFKADKGSAYGKGLLWPGGSYTKQFVLRQNPDRLFSSENLDLHENAEYKIANHTVLSADSLGTDVIKSNLKKVGTLVDLNVQGQVNFGGLAKFNPDTEQFSIGSEDPNGMLSLESLEHEFVIDHINSGWKFGTWTTSDLNVITDDTTRIEIKDTGKINVHSKTSFSSSVGIGVKNFSDDCSLTLADPIKIQGHTQRYDSDVPTIGNYGIGDIIWNSSPRPTGYIGWVCTRDGSPGEWKPFGQISS